MNKSVFLHIGTHKTGTTSIQYYMSENNKKNNMLGIDYYKGLHIDSNHVELHMASMRENRYSPFKVSSGIQVDNMYRKMVQDRINEYMVNTPYQSLIFSAEGLSYLRYDDELCFLRELFCNIKVYIILYLREKNSFLASYRKQLLKTGYIFSEDTNSFAYVNDDTWLTDNKSLINAYGKAFGYENLIIQSYDNLLEQNKDILPSFLSTIGANEQYSVSMSNWYNKS